MDKFKVGDKVVIVAGPVIPDELIGVEGVIAEIDHDFPWPYFVRHPKDTNTAPCSADEIRLVQEKQ